MNQFFKSIMDWIDKEDQVDGEVKIILVGILGAIFIIVIGIASAVAITHIIYYIMHGIDIAIQGWPTL